MRTSKRRWIILGLLLAILVLAPLLFWFSLTHQPRFYRDLVQAPSPLRHQTAARFRARSAQLRNDIMNEPRWDAAFTDQQVNAWLAEDLVEHFADQIPPGVHEPRVSFETDRIILAFQLEKGSIRSVISVVARVRVPRENVLALTIEQIRAGVLPISADQILEQITDYARGHGLEVDWQRENGLPVAMIHYRPNVRRRDIVLETLLIANGQIRLSGRSDRRSGAAAALTLPSKRLLQSTFPRRKVQLPRYGSSPEASVFSSSAWPLT